MKKILVFLFLFGFMSLFAQKRVDQQPTVNPTNVKYVVIDANGLTKLVDAFTAQKYAMPKVSTISGTLSSTGNSAYLGGFVKESNSTVVTAYVDSSGVKHSMTQNLSGYLTTSTVAGGDLTGTYPNPEIRLDAVVTNRIANDAVTSAKIAPNAISSSHIEPNAVTTSKIAIGEVKNANIGDGAVDGRTMKKTGASDGDAYIFDAATNSFVLKPIPTTNVSAYATISNVDTAKAAIRQEMTDKNNYVQQNLTTTNTNISTNYALKSEIGKGAKNTLYVQREWTGTRGGASWTAQANAAKVGSTAFAFCDIKQALDTFVKYKKAGIIQKGHIVILSGNYFSYGEVGTGSDYESNSSVNYYSESTVDSATSLNLAYRDLTYEFHENSGIIDNTTTGNKALFSDNGNAIRFRVVGKGNFSKKNKVGSKTISFTNVLSDASFEFETFSTKGLGSGSIFMSDAQFFTFKAKQVNAVTAYSMWISSAMNGTVIIDIENHNVGKYAELSTNEAIGAYTVTDANTPFIVRNVFNSLFFVNVKNANIEDSEGVFNIGNLKTSKLVINFDNLTQSSQASQYAYASSRSFLRGDIDSLSFLSATIKYAETDMPIALFDAKRNSNANINVLECKYNNTSVNANPALSVNSDSTSSVTVQGRYESVTNNIVTCSNFSNVLLQGVYKTSAVGKSAIVVSNTDRLKIAGSLQGESSIIGTGTVIILPSATANTAAAETVNLKGAALNVNAIFKF